MQNYYQGSQFWGTPIDLVMSAYIEFVFAVFINFIMFTTEGETYSYGVWINNIYLVCSTVLIVVYPFWLYFFLKMN